MFIHTKIKDAIPFEECKMKEIIEAVEPQRELYDYAATERIGRAAEIAKPLKQMIDQQGLFEEINGQQYVRVEGWQAVITLCGLRTREERCTIDEHGITVYVQIVDRHGDVIGEGAGMVGKDEPQHLNLKDFQKRSLANSRAISRAARNCLGWIVHLAGYATTPSEEMDGVKSAVPLIYQLASSAIEACKTMEQVNICRTQLQIRNGEGKLTADEYLNLSMMLDNVQNELEANEDVF
jgi:hypothetical protein